MQRYSNVVAIIDDDEMWLLLIKKILEHKKVAETILQFSSGIAASLYLKNKATDFENLPSVILLDITMPGMSGWQFLDELGKIKFSEDYDPAVFLISASATMDFERMKNYHFIKGYITKPVMPDKLVEMIESAMMANSK